MFVEGFWVAFTVQLLLGLLAGGLTGLGVKVGSTNLTAIGTLLVLLFLWLTYNYMPVDLAVVGFNWEVLAEKFGEFEIFVDILFKECIFIFGLLVSLAVFKLQP
jgi:uncharacterized membrane protein